MTIAITRHMLTLPNSGRRVHYRRCGNGPVLLMVHQSPRSSAEYEALMQKWGVHFTCIAPDTPGFGQSDPLPQVDGTDPDINDFADALCEFLDALGVARCPAYGFHSGGIILVTALKRHNARFECIAVGGYAVWNEEEMRIFGERYLPDFHPRDYGEHLTWVWNRMLEQSWVFPWFDTREEARLSGAHADVARINQAVMEMLDAGNHYREGYGAVLGAPRDIPDADAKVPPCLITAYDGDPLQSHIDRLGEMPDGWEAQKVKNPADHQTESLAFLMAQSAKSTTAAVLAEDADEGWLAVEGGLIHWKGQRGGKLILHPPASGMEEPGPGELAIEAPGHGQSDDFTDVRTAIEAAITALNAKEIVWPSVPSGDPAELYPDLKPDRFGQHLQRAWAIARAEAFFEPWYEANAAHAIPLDSAKLDPQAIQSRALARIHAGSAALRWHEFLLSRNGDSKK